MGDHKSFVINNGVLKDYKGSGGDVIIPEGVTHIGEDAFCNCKTLTGVEFPESVKYIGARAFYNCGNLTSIKIPEGVTEIKEKTFADCRRLSSIVLPERLTSIEAYAFFECSKLKNIIFPEGLNKIGRMAFSSCKSLNSIRIPEGVRRIGERAFSYCRRLRRVELTCDSIIQGDKTFIGCKNLKIITCWTPHTALCVNDIEDLCLLYLGGPVSKLFEECRENAARGYLYAQEHGIKELEGWRAEYLEYIRNHAQAFIRDAVKSNFILLFLIKEELLSEEAARMAIKQYGDELDIKGKAALLQYLHEKFGSGDAGDFIL